MIKAGLIDGRLVNTARSLRSFIALCAAGILLAGFIFSGQAHAALQLNSALLNVASPAQGPASVVYVQGGGTITADVNGSTAGTTNWRSTSWQIGAGPFTCDNTTDFNTNNSTTTLSFPITAPTTAGTYNTSFIAYSDNGCNNSASNTLVLTGSIVVDNTAPSVTSIVRANANPTSGPDVSWIITFSENVTGVVAGDFTLAQGGGLSGAAVTAVSGSGTTWTVTASIGTGSGTLGLNLSSAAGIADRAGNALAGVPVTGEVYTVNGSTAATVTASPTLCVSDPSNGGTYAWTGLGNVGTQNNVYASANGYNSSVTEYLKCTGYGFSIPAGATVNGITVGVWRYSRLTMSDHAMQLVKANSIQATNLATNTRFPGSNTEVLYGGATNLWGNTWTAADINSATFGAAFAAIRGPYNSTDTAFVDYMPITVDYTLPSTPTVTSIDLASTNPTSPATSVSWAVTFSTSVAGVAAGNFALVQSGGVSGAGITSVTGSGTTWTVTANTGSGYGTLGLNMTSVTGISPAVTTAMPFVGQVYTISAPMTCVTDNFSTGTLDPTLWSVKTILGPYLPQVINAGGGDYRLRLTDTQNNEATFAQLKRTFPAAGNKVVLEIDYFSYGGSGADGIAVTFSDATFSSTTGGFGGSLGYAQNNTNPGFGGGWMGIGLDEYGNYPCNNESRTGYPAGWTDPVLGAGATVCGGSGGSTHYVAVRGSGSGTTGYNLLANTGNITATAPASGAAGTSPYRYRFTLDHSDSVHAYVTVERDTTGTGNSYTTLVPKFDVKASSVQANVPANWLVSFTGSTGGSTNNHEIKQVKVCANAIVGGGPDHLEIDHAGTAISCSPETVTVKACANADCSSLYSGGVSGNLTAGGNSVAFSIPGGSSQTTVDIHVPSDSAVADPQIVRLGTSSVSPAPSDTNGFYCSNSGGTPNTTTACDISVYKAGFLFNVPNLTSGAASGSVDVSAVRSSDSTTCVPLFKSVTRTVAFWSEYQNPASGTLPLQVNGSNIETVITTATPAYGSTYSLNFNNSGVATLTSVQYDDVGLMKLNARYVGSTLNTPPDGGMIVLGSDTFVVKPDHFELSAIKRTSDGVANPAAANAAGTVFAKAGEQFSVTVTAKNSLGNTTPNYGKESAPEGVKLTSSLFAPAGGSDPGVNGTFGAFSNGVATADGVTLLPDGVTASTPFTWNEVGIITLNPSVGDADYLGAGDVTGTASGNVGRFIPDHFNTTVNYHPASKVFMLCPAGLTCPVSGDLVYNNGFVYSGQPVTVNVYAKNASDVTTSNYDGTLGFSKTATLSAYDAAGSVTVPANGALNNNSVSAASFKSGATTLGIPPTPDYTFGTVPTAPTDIYLRAADGEATSLRGTSSVEGGIKVVSGKVKISNAHGSELLPLPLTATVQYWNGSGWMTSTTDSSTRFNTNLSTAGGNIVANILTGLGSGVSVATPNWVTVGSGVKTFALNKPGIVGSADISLNAPSYLLGGSNGAGINPSKAGRATFGVYKGPSEFIYLRENY